MCIACTEFFCRDFEGDSFERILWWMGEWNCKRVFVFLTDLGPLRKSAVGRRVSEWLCLRDSLDLRENSRKGFTEFLWLWSWCCYEKKKKKKAKVLLLQGREERDLGSSDPVVPPSSQVCTYLCRCSRVQDSISGSLFPWNQWGIHQ